MSEIKVLLLKICSFSKKKDFLNKFLVERSRIEKIVSKIDFLNLEILDFIELLDLVKKDNDQILFKELFMKLKFLRNKYSELEILAFFPSSSDFMNTFLDIQAGSGGHDAQDWVDMLLKMYSLWCEKRRFKYNVTSLSRGDAVGIKSVSLKVVGEYSYGWLKNECGIHRLVRKSPFNSNGKRHTSFASVFIYPCSEQNCNIKINDFDLKIDTFKASGAGGQHVNKTESAVRVKHIPTGVVVQCQSERSQHKNKTYAIKQLKLKLHALYMLNKKKDKEKIEKNKMNISWGNQIRSYFLDKSFIKDSRTGLETSNVSMVLGGGLDPFIYSVLRMGKF